MEKIITIYRFEDAPDELKGLSTNGGDEDWIALVPKAFVHNMYLGWLERIDTCQEPEVLDHPTLPDYEVWIGSHA